MTKLVEQSLSISLSTLFVRNLYTLAVSLAKSRGLPKDELGEIYRRFVSLFLLFVCERRGVDFFGRFSFIYLGTEIIYMLKLIMRGL